MSTQQPTPTAFYEGQIAYWEDRSEEDNPYLLLEERSKLKEDWNQKAQDWDDGWADACCQDADSI
jgi:hypothetical protein